MSTHETNLTDRQRFAAELAKYRDEYFESSDLPEPIVKDQHPLYLAYKTVKPDAEIAERAAWQTLLTMSRGGAAYGSQPFNEAIGTLMAWAEDRNTERSSPMSKTELARRLTGRDTTRTRDIDTSAWDRHDLQPVAGRPRLHTIRLDRLDPGQLKRIQEFS